MVGLTGQYYVILRRHLVSVIYPGRFPDLASFRVLESTLWLKGVGCG